MKTRIFTLFTCLLLAGQICNAAHHASKKVSCADAIIGHYFATQEALAADDLDTTKVAAKALSAAQEDSPCAKEIGEATKAIVKAADIDAARVAFKTLSDAVIPLIEAEGVNSSQAHLVHCSMAFEFSGASWLQKDKPVANPYFGSQMFACGSVEQSFGEEK
jgi:Cu(I)/Ag(I) efflux system membrane fusion protein